MQPFQSNWSLLNKSRNDPITKKPRNAIWTTQKEEITLRPNPIPNSSKKLTGIRWAQSSTPRFYAQQYLQDASTQQRFSIGQNVSNLQANFVGYSKIEENSTQKAYRDKRSVKTKALGDAVFSVSPQIVGRFLSVLASLRRKSVRRYGWLGCANFRCNFCGNTNLPVFFVVIALDYFFIMEFHSYQRVIL